MNQLPPPKKIRRKAGRPSHTISLDTLSPKQQITETALKLFYQFGINAVGTSQIIGEAKVAKMTFFKHFPTKRDLILEALHLRDERYMLWLQKTLDSISTDTSERLHAFVDVIEIWFRSLDFRGCAFINTAVESGPGSSLEKKICLLHKKKMMDFIHTLATEAGYKNARQISLQLVTAIDGATVRAQMDGPESGIEALRTCAKVIFKNL